MANSVAEAVIGAVVLATAVGFVVYAGQTPRRADRRRQLPADRELPQRRGDRRRHRRAAGRHQRRLGHRPRRSTPRPTRRRTTFAVRRRPELPDDFDVKIASEGLLGGSFVEITPGGSEFMLAPGDEIANTQGSVSLLNLLMRFGTGQMTPAASRHRPRARRAAQAVAAQSAALADPRDTVEAPRPAPARARQPQRHRPGHRRARWARPSASAISRSSPRPAGCRATTPKADAYAFLRIRDMREESPRFSGLDVRLVAGAVGARPPALRRLGGELQQRLTAGVRGGSARKSAGPATRRVERRW